jgi:hypothetical protein
MLERKYKEKTWAELSTFERDYRDLLYDAYLRCEVKLLRRGEHPFFAHCAICSLRIDTRDMLVVISWSESPLWYRGEIYTHESCYRFHVSPEEATRQLGS